MTHWIKRSPRSAVVLALVLFVGTSGCSKKSDEAAAATVTGAPLASAAPSAIAMTSPVGSAPASPAAPLGGDQGLATTLSDRLAREAASRPPIHPNADDVLAALAKAGGTVVTKKQGLGATYKANFCEGGTTSDGAVTLSICEYPDDASAKTGLASLQAIYPAKMSTHTLNKDTVLTTLRLQDGPPAQALENKLIAAYKAL
jgi:hypothetical protein